MAETVQFYLKYSGSAVDQGRMDVRLFGPALMAVAAACQEADRTLNQGRTQVSVFVDADIEQSSFLVTLEIAQQGIEVVQGFLGANTTAAEILDLLGLAGVEVQGSVVRSALALWKFLRGKKPAAVERREGGVVTLTDSDGNTVNADQRAYTLVQKGQITNNFTTLSYPLTMPGIDSLEVGVKGRGRDTVTPEDVPQEELSEEEESDQPIYDQAVVDMLEIVTPAFREGLKWRFARGGASFPAAMEAPDFLARVEAGEKFQKGDILRARIRTVATEVGGTLKYQHVVEEVLEHVDRASRGGWRQQTLLPPSDENG